MVPRVEVRMTRNGTAMNSAAALLVGFAAGSATALLLAPQSGRRTRRDISRKIEGAQDYLSDAGGELMKKGEELACTGERLVKSK